ncbi:MAG: nucleotidyltransferase family protein, partial [Lentisphaeraceae bacterium]|nr:nucleotidyltransferase family protein [Lentisphaeraceae bacterium]
MSINLFIPAAGYGTRLKPLTDDFPKPLLPVCGIPLIQRIIESVQSQVDIKNIGINTHYLPEVVQEWADDCPFSEKIELFHEEEILGTGGALKNAESLFGKETCLLANGDVISGIDWAELIKFHKENKNLVTLAVQDREHERRVGADSEMNLVCIDKTCSDPSAEHWFGYACAAVYEPEFLKYLPEGESHVVPFWVDASKETGRVKVFNIGRETYWLDIGNPQSYSQAITDTLLTEKRYLNDPLSTPTFSELEGSVVIEKSVDLGNNVALRNVIALPGAKINDGLSLENCIVTPNGKVDIEWPEISDNCPKPNKIGNGGSDRIYSREGDRVKLIYSAFEQNIERQIDLTQKLSKTDVNVPLVYSVDRNKREVFLQDLGDETFGAWMKGKTDSEIEIMLDKIFKQLKLFQFSNIQI